MNDEELNYLTREFNHLRPILRPDLELVVERNRVAWSTDDSSGESFQNKDPFDQSEWVEFIMDKNNLKYFVADSDEKFSQEKESSFDDSQVDGSTPYLDRKYLYQQGERILDNFRDPTLHFKDESKRATGVRLLWWDHYWDGPLAGPCEWNGKKYYFENIDPHLREYQYTMREMDQSEWDARHQKHLLYQQYNGTYKDYFYDENGQELYGYKRTYNPDESERKKYLEIEHPPIPISKNPPSAWFQR